MKKILSVLILWALLVGLVGCSNNEPTDETIKDAPAYIASMFNKMNKLAKTNKFQFKACEYSASDLTGDRFLLNYTGKSDGVASLLDFTFFNNPEIGLSTTGIFKDREEARPGYLEDIVTALLMVVKPSISLHNAKAEMQKLFASRPTESSTTRYSDVLEIEGYKFWFDAGNSKKNGELFQESFNMRKANQMFQENLKTENTFTELTKDNAQEAGSAKGGMYKFTGKVNDFILAEWEHYSTSEVESTNGQKIIVAYDYGYYPVEFEKGKTYTFYGPNITFMDAATLISDRELNIPVIDFYYAE